MLKQSPSRTHRSKGFKVKHVLQMCLLLAICIWLLNQLKHSYDKNKAYQDGDGKVSEEVESEQEILKLSRKVLNPQVKTPAVDNEIQGDKDELEEETEEIKPEEIEDERRGGGDDEIDGHDQEREEEEDSEEVLEDLIDVDDRDGEEQESEEKGNDEDASAIDDEAKNVGEQNVREAREEHYKGDDASSSVAHHTRSISAELEIGGLQKMKKKDVENEEDIASNSDSSTKAVANEKPQVKFNSRLMLAENSAF